MGLIWLRFFSWVESILKKFCFHTKIENLKSICKNPSVNKRINYQPFAKILLPQLTSDHHFSTHPALISSYFNRGAVALLQSRFWIEMASVKINWNSCFLKLEDFLSALKWIKELKIIFEGFYIDLFPFYKMLSAGFLRDTFFW